VKRQRDGEQQRADEDEAEDEDKGPRHGARLPDRPWTDDRGWTAADKFGLLWPL
jgi:hypothetical protein